MRSKEKGVQKGAESMAFGDSDPPRRHAPFSCPPAICDLTPNYGAFTCGITTLAP